MEPDYIKSMIQEALWHEYKRTGNEDYKVIYELWYEKFELIDISVLGGIKNENN